MQRKKYKHRDTNNSVDDEFGSNYMSEEEFNKKHMKALEQADPHNFILRTKGRNLFIQAYFSYLFHFAQSDCGIDGHYSFGKV